MAMLVTSHDRGDSAVWNTAYPDGRVTPFADPELYELFAQGFDGRSEWLLFNEVIRPRILPAEDD